jgi:hypothetical protein
VIAFLSWTGWPLVDLLIRIWIGKLALVLSVLISRPNRMSGLARSKGEVEEMLERVRRAQCSSE